MKINATALSLPSWKLENEEVLDLIKYNSRSTFSGNLEKTLRKIDFVLKKTGAGSRYWLDRQKQERPIDHIIKAAEEAIAKSDYEKDDIDLLIYVGIGRGFIEPGNGYAVAKDLGMNKVRCFDVIDACMSWTATMQIVDSLFKTGAYKNAMVINGEFTVQGGPLFKNFQLESEDQVEWTFPSFTVGEGATCTILSPDKNDNFEFNFSSRNDMADLCVIPTPDYKDFCQVTDKVGRNGEMRFTSFGYNLHAEGQKEIVKLFNESNINKDEIDIVFTHASSKSEWTKYGQEVGIDDKMYHIYHKTGNLVSASVPAAIAMAQEEGAIKRGDKTLLWVGSAGMSFVACVFEY